MRVSHLVKEHFEARRQAFTVPSMSMPIAPKPAELPIVAVDRWQLVGRACLRKTFRFDSEDRRNDFVVGVLSYERQVGHHGKLLVELEQVTIDIMTHDVGVLTELDREYARYCDVLFQDVAYSSPYEGDSQP